ncbi:hypothetical protein ABBQ38_000814 [Trebouxia sp. C0009 RCD-2024]
MATLACLPGSDVQDSDGSDSPDGPDSPDGYHIRRKVGVPMYLWPGLTTPCGWEQVVKAAAQVDLLILNPDSGPGKQSIETFSMKADICSGAGQRVLGYVSSNYMRRDIKDVLRDIEKYRSWYALEGFFIDEMYCTDLAGLEYYKQIRKAVKSDRSKDDTTHANQLLVFNPGVPQVPEAYMPVADVFVVFEGSAQAYVSYQASQYATKHSMSKFWHIVHSCSTEDLVMQTLRRFHEREAKWLYMTDLTMPNPYCSLGSKEVWQRLLSYMSDSSDRAAVKHIS